MISTLSLTVAYDEDAWIQTNKILTTDCVENKYSTRNVIKDTVRVVNPVAEAEKVAKDKFEKEKATAKAI